RLRSPALVCGAVVRAVGRNQDVVRALAPRFLRESTRDLLIAGLEVHLYVADLLTSRHQGLGLRHRDARVGVFEFRAPEGGSENRRETKTREEAFHSDLRVVVRHKPIRVASIPAISSTTAAAKGSPAMI